MADLHHSYDMRGVVYLVQDSVGALPDAVTGQPGHFQGAAWAGLGGERSYARHNEASVPERLDRLQFPGG